MPYSFKQFLEEGRDAPLYHSTAYRSGCIIFEDNEIRARTYHIKKSMLDDKAKIKKAFSKRVFGGSDEYVDGVAGVSLTRNFKFAKSWGDIIFEVDQKRLTQRYKIIPFNYFVDQSSKPANFRKEAEEFVIGNIFPLNKYLIKIHISVDYMSEFEERYGNKLKGIEVVGV
jgi:hypothetical protein